MHGERRPVRNRRSEIGVPGIQVGIEVHHRDRPMLGVHGPKQRQRDRVVTADRDKSTDPLQKAACTGLDIGHGLIDGKRVHRQIAGVGHLVHRERMDVERRVEGSE
ncbi:MAG: hypothetical protein QOE71_2750 [Pseudonocardiales bacterium]|nr:hypothetical protein [Pseudonocardiales bacterium]